MLGRPRLLVSCLVCITATVAGCAENEVPDAPTPSVRMPSRTIRHPLTEAEVETFLAVLNDLPEGKAPEFEPLSQVTANETLPGVRLAEIFRQEFRAMFDASRHGERWRKDATLASTFEEHRIEPEDFAALMMRMSCAITANTISSRVNLEEAATKTDHQIAALIRQIEQIDQGSRTQTSIDHRRRTLESLEDLVAFSEFSRILMEVPAESCAVVSRHKSQLAGHLPQAGNVERFERTIESSVVPTSFEQKATNH